MDRSHRGTAAPVSPADRTLAESFAGKPFELLTRADRIVARGNHLAAQNDEQELRAFFAECEADAQAILRGEQR